MAKVLLFDLIIFSTFIKIFPKVDAKNVYDTPRDAIVCYIGIQYLSNALKLIEPKNVCLAAKCDAKYLTSAIYRDNMRNGAFKTGYLKINHHEHHLPMI